MACHSRMTRVTRDIAAGRERVLDDDPHTERVTLLARRGTSVAMVGRRTTDGTRRDRVMIDLPYRLPHGHSQWHRRLPAAWLAALTLTGALAAPADAADCRRDESCNDAPACAVIQSVADLDVPQVRLGGDLFVNGAPPFWFPAHTGTLELVSPTLGRVTLGQLHDGDYDVMVIPGVYDVVYRHDAGIFVPENTEAVILRDVAILVGQRLDISVPAVWLSGTFTLGGAPTPSSVYERGALGLRDPVTGAITTLGYTNDHTYTAFVVPGTYDVVYRLVLGGTIVPKNALVTLLEGVEVTGGTLDIDVPVVTRSGTFKIGGALAPQSAYENGRVYLRDAAGNVTDIGQTRDRTYTVKLVPGVYDAMWSHLIGDSIVPRNTWAEVVANAPMVASGSLDINVPVVAIGGDMRLDGQAFPGSNYNRARFWLEGASPWDVFPVGYSNDHTYAARVVPGTYDVRYQGLTTTGLVPANPWLVVEHDRSILPAKGVRVVDLGVTSGWLDVEVTLWGDAPPASVYEHGKIRARPVGGGGRFELFRTHQSPEAVRVVAGDYDVSYEHMLGDTIVPLNGDALLGAGHAQLLLPSAATLDMRPGPLSGVFTHGGLPFTAAPAESAELGLRDVVTGDVISLGPTHTGFGYDVILLAGTYDIVYDHIAGGAIPANRDATLGCITFAPIDPSAQAARR